MSVPEKPKKPKQKRSKSKRINLNSKKQWESLLKSVDKDEIPLQLLLGITVNLRDGSQVHIDVKELLEEGVDPEDLQGHLDDKFEQLDDFIEDVDFFIHLDAVKETVQSFTDNLLKDIR